MSRYRLGPSWCLREQHGPIPDERQIGFHGTLAICETKETEATLIQYWNESETDCSIPSMIIYLTHF